MFAPPMFAPLMFGPLMLDFGHPREPVPGMPMDGILEARCACHGGTTRACRDPPGARPALISAATTQIRRIRSMCTDVDARLSKIRA
jgi:hypothetical protein